MSVLHVILDWLLVMVGVAAVAGFPLLRALYRAVRRRSAAARNRKVCAEEAARSRCG